MSSVSFVEELVEKIVQKRDEKEKAAEKVSEINGELNALKEQAIKVLEELELEDYRGKAGTITRKVKWSVKIPTTDADKAKLFDYLREHGLFDRYATVNSRAINTLFMDLWETAKEEGKGDGFTIPGIEQPKMYEDLGIRKRK